MHHYQSAACCHSPIRESPVVLVANGEESTMRWISATVETAGIRAIGCDSAGELLDRVKRGAPTCVVLDIALPDGNGLDIQAKLARAGAAIVFLTRERCISSCVRAIKAGAVDFLVLPCEASALLHALRNALRTTLHASARMKYLDELGDRFARLTPRERQVLELVCAGKLNKQIADDLAITEFTVQVHRGRVMRKMRARSFAELVRMSDALRNAPDPSECDY